MGLEVLTGTSVYLNALNALNPLDADGKDEGDDHVRGIKNVYLNTFPNITGAINCTPAQLNLLYQKTLASSSPKLDNFPSGTLMLFRESSAPNGWTKETTHNNKALRVVGSGAWNGSGGNQPFTTVFGRTATDGHLLTAAESGVKYHAHIMADYLYIATPAEKNIDITSGGPTDRFATKTSNQNTAVNASQVHSHDFDLRVQYVDIIIASKNA